MIVDDDLQICSLVADILSQSYRVEKAGDGREALEKVRKECPDLIITDVDMPEINGLELIKRLKEDEMTRFIPVIFLAFKTDVASEVSAYNLGSEAFIQKPFLPQQLTAVVGGVLKNRMSLKGYYKSAMSEMEVFQGKTMNTKEKEFLTTLIQIIEQNITDDISPASVAEKLCISEMTLYRRIKELAGQRPSEFIRGIKLSRAAHLLKTTDMTVQEIMFDCGFNNKSYFYRTFSATYGMSPKEYRKAL
jgi:YesN/AraC family two-component response regulator